MKDKGITIKVKGNAKEFNDVIKDATKHLNIFTKAVKNNKFNNLAISTTALINSFSMLKGAISTASAIVKDLLESYRTQIDAETKLQQAAKNNPYLDSSSVKHLKDYASELQSISTYGDEELLPMMANLAAQGKTESQIMDVMSAALDLAAGSGMSLDSAVTALNATLAGNAGTLGKQNAAIKALTAEELKNGKAIEIIKQQYAGMAEETAKATGTSKQLQNAIGDLKEEFGKTFEEGAKPVRKFFTEFFSNWAKFKKQRRIDAENSDIDVETEKLQGLKELYTEYNKLGEKARKAQGLEVDFIAIKKAYLEQIEIVENLKTKLQEEAEANEELAEARKKAETEAATQDTAQKALDTYNKTIEKKLKEIELNRQAAELQGKQFDEQKAMQEELEVRAKAYAQLLEDAQGTITGNSEREVKEREKILELVKKTAEVQGGELNDKQKEQYENLIKEIDALSNNQIKKQSEVMQDYIKNLDEQYKDVIDNETLTQEERLRIEQEYTKSHKKLLDLQAQAVQEEQEQEKQATIAGVQAKLQTASEFVNVYAQTMTTLSNMVTKAAENEAKAKTAAIDKQLADGIISQEEYEAKKEKIEKEAAEKQYKIQMWEWSASLLQIAVNTAEGITKALAQTGVVGIALASAIGALGAVQLTAAMVNRPVKPSFSTGGIVGGTSYTGDKVQANLNSREMVLNMRQQKAMFDALNNGTIGTKGGTNIKIYNSVSNLIKTQTQTDQNGDISLYITGLVKAGIASGDFNQALESANSKIGGIRYTN